MGEGTLQGILGDEEHKPEVEAPETLAGAEAFASAIAAKLSGNDPGVARKTEIFLEKQAQILETQNEHLKEEHSLRLAHLHHQLSEENVRRFGLRLRVAFQLFVALFATVIGIGIAIMIRDAVTSRSVVIDPIAVPPALAAQGFGDRIVASRLADRLTEIQSATRSSIQKRNISDAWSNEISLEVPETGLSVGEVERALKTRLGHDQHISGDLVEKDNTGLSLTVRGSGVLPKTFLDSRGDLNALVGEAAEYVYSQAQPALWVAYLVQFGRYQEAVDFCHASIGTSSPSDRPALLTNWAVAIVNTLGAVPDVISLTRRAIDYQPDYWEAYDILMTAQALSGDEEGAWQTGNYLRKTSGGQPGRAPQSVFATVCRVTWDVQCGIKAAMGDLESSGGSGTWSYATGPTVAAFQIVAHDIEGAEYSLQTTKPDPADPTIVPFAHFLRGMIAAEKGDVTSAVAELDQFLPAYSNPVVAWAAWNVNCLAAPIEEAAGHPDKTDAILKAGGTALDCYRFRGDVLDSRGDWKGAQEWYSRSVQLAPDLPAGYYSWGVALAKHGDLVRAEMMFRDAHQRGPRWAEPLKAWGDLLAKKLETSDALGKYEEALMYAPKWKQLREVHDAVHRLTISQRDNNRGRVVPKAA